MCTALVAFMAANDAAKGFGLSTLQGSMITADVQQQVPLIAAGAFTAIVAHVHCAWPPSTEAQSTVLTVDPCAQQCCIQCSCGTCSLVPVKLHFTIDHRCPGK